MTTLILCASCSGFWLGLGCGALGWWRGLPFLGLPHDHWSTVIAAGFGGIVWTPLVVYPVLLVLEVLSSTDGDDS